MVLPLLTTKLSSTKLSGTRTLPVPTMASRSVVRHGFLAVGDFLELLERLVKLLLIQVVAQALKLLLKGVTAECLPRIMLFFGMPMDSGVMIS